MKGNIHTILFYKFVNLSDVDKFARKHRAFCNKNKILGRILIGKEGINGSVTGTKKQIENYKKELMKDERFSDIVFKEDIGKEKPFTKMAVLVRDEIIAMKKKVNLKNKAPYLSPSELFKMYNDREDFVILDARNDYEWKVGKFKNALVLPIKTFREFPDAVDKIKGKLKGKKIVTYCTGGIRCEKASAYMKENKIGKEIYQLKDGIITFCKELPDTAWQGKCFVFDKRLMANYNNGDGSEVGKCEICHGKCDLYRNCRSNECDRLVVMCVSCEKKMNGCCSAKCLDDFRQACLIKSFVNQGRRTRS